MKDQVALITGASGDIGQAISKELLRAGRSTL
jgi:NAD(P)-dependent dehydrogenase (short-subunit alcohol dehydrogenase family)